MEGLTLNRVLEGWMRVEEAAYIMGLSERHAWRLLAAYRKHGAKALSHGNRGSRPVSTTSPMVQGEGRRPGA